MFPMARSNPKNFAAGITWVGIARNTDVWFQYYTDVMSFVQQWCYFNVFIWLKVFLLKPFVHLAQGFSAQVFLLRSLLGAWACCLRLPGVMPLSKEQMDLLKDGSTPIQFAKDNPKKVGSKVWDRYEQYKDANSISQAREKKAGWQDVTADFEKGFLKIMEGHGRGSTGPNQKTSPRRHTR